MLVKPVWQDLAKPNFLFSLILYYLFQFFWNTRQVSYTGCVLELPPIISVSSFYVSWSHPTNRIAISPSSHLSNRLVSVLISFCVLWGSWWHLWNHMGGSCTQEWVTWCRGVIRADSSRPQPRDRGEEAGGDFKCQHEKEACLRCLLCHLEGLLNFQAPRTITNIYANRICS